MKIAYFPNQTAYQSEPVWQAFLESCRENNIEPVENSLEADAAVIWSVLWWGRLRQNQQVYKHYRNQGKPVFIIEVGALKRGTTWKVCVNNITSAGIYPNADNLDNDRPKKLDLSLYPVRHDARTSILLASQHPASLQWEGMLSIEKWIDSKIQEIRQYSDRQILIRQHPRYPVRINAHKGVAFSVPKKIPNTYDEYDLGYNHHCIINHCSGPSIQAPIHGIPVICDVTSLAYPVSSQLSEIENLKIPNREEWFIKLCHTEWTIEEIRQGIPLKRLVKDLTL